jgi:tripartite ATP-independent transporter DctM subunit
MSFAGLLLAALLGVPLFAVVSALALVVYGQEDMEPAFLAIEMVGVFREPALAAIPQFTFAGYLMAESKTPERLVRLARASVGWMPGGIAIVSVVACAFFTAFTGASGITIIALGGLLFPILTEEGFPERFNLGLLTSGGSLGLLFPPSLPVILYAIVAGAEVEVDALFAAALVPGAVLVSAMALYSALVARRVPAVTRVPFRAKALLDALRAARWELSLPVVILSGIYGGWLTVGEAATVTVVIVLVVNVALYRDLHLLRDVPRVMVKSAVLVGAILLILGAAKGLSDAMTIAGIPDAILAWIQASVDSRLGFLIALNLFLLAVGSLLDVFSAIIVVVPLILPLARQYGVDPLHLGVIFLTNLEIGYMTPPVGMNLFLSSFRFRRPLTTLYWASLPFIGVLLAALLVITYVPALSLWAAS